MKKFIVCILGIVFLASCYSTIPYDSKEVKTTMRKIMGTANSISGSLKKDDLSTVSDDFKVLKEQFQKLTKMEAPKGSNEEWLLINKEMVSLSIEGQKAAKSGDSEKIGTILAKIFEQQKKGHNSFKQ